MQIKDAVTASGVNASTIRFYEKKGLITIERDQNGDREFDDQAVDRLLWIHCYRNSGLTIKEIANIVDQKVSSTGYIEILNNSQQRLQEKIDALKQTQASLDKKIQTTQITGRVPTDFASCEEICQ